MSSVTEALKAARLELDSMGGLWVTDETEDNPHGERWRIDTTKTINKIEQALAVSEQSLSERIEAAYNEVIEQQGKMLEAEKEIERPDNQEAERAATSRLDDARASFHFAALEIKRLELLVELAKARDSREAL